MLKILRQFSVILKTYFYEIPSPPLRGQTGREEVLSISISSKKMFLIGRFIPPSFSGGMGNFHFMIRFNFLGLNDELLFLSLKMLKCRNCNKAFFMNN